MYEFSDDDTRIDRALVHEWLSTQAYWALGRTREVQDRAIDGSRNFGAYAEGRQVAYARVVTDGVTFGWVCDVFVDASARGDGVGTGLMRFVVGTLDQLGVKRLILVTADAHEVYARVGFTLPPDPERWMVRRTTSP